MTIHLPTCYPMWRLRGGGRRGEECEYDKQMVEKDK